MEAASFFAARNEWQIRYSGQRVQIAKESVLLLLLKIDNEIRRKYP